MKFNKIILILFALAALTLNACSDDDEPHHENTATISLGSPSNDIEFEYGETVHIHAVATGEMTLHGYSVKIVNAFGEELFHAHKHDHDIELTIDEEWVNNVTETSLITITITVALDHDGAVESKVLKVLCHAAS